MTLRNRRCAVGDKYQRITSQAATGTATEASMNNDHDGFLAHLGSSSLASTSWHTCPSMPAEFDPGIPTDPMSGAGGEP
jgi:hypothetical protein